MSSTPTLHIECDGLLIPGKTCIACEKVFPLGNFYMSVRDGRTYYTGRCRPCYNLKQNRLEKQNPANRWKNTLAYKYGITPLQYETRVREQNNLCAACGKPEVRKTATGAVKRLSIDHNHATQTLRELLCDRCNVTIGRVKENAETLRRMAAYIEKHNGVMEDIR